MAQENPIYKFLRENNLTQKSEADFLAEYSTPEKVETLHGFMTENNLTTKDFDSFYGEYFKKKAPTEVSGQDSASGVPTSGEPLSTSQENDTQPEVEDVVQKSQSLTNFGNSLTGQPTFGDLVNRAGDNVIFNLAEEQREKEAFQRRHTPDIEGTFREGWAGNWSYDRDGYENYQLPEEMFQSVFGGDATRAKEYFSKEMPNVLVHLPTGGEYTGQAEISGVGNIVNYDTAEPNDLDQIEFERMLSSIDRETLTDESKVQYDLAVTLGDMVKNYLPQQKTRDERMMERAIEHGEALAESDDDRWGITKYIGTPVANFAEGIGREGTRLLANVMGIPEFVHDSLANGINQVISTLGGDPEFLHTWKEDWGESGNPIDTARDYMYKAAERGLAKNEARYGDLGIWESLQAGNYDDAANKLADGLGGMIPFTAMLMATRGQGSLLLGTGAVAAGQYEDLQESDLSQETRLLNSLINGISETGFETLGNKVLLEPLERAVKNFGKERGAQIAQSTLEKALRKTLGRFYPLAPIGIEVTSELATETTNNITARVTGEDPDRKWSDGLEDVAIISTVYGGGSQAITSAVQSINKRQSLASALKLNKENAEIETALNDPELTQEERIGLSNKYQDNLEQINGYIIEEQEKKQRLNGQQRALVEDLEVRKARIAPLLESDRVPDSVKESSQEEINEINDQIEEIMGDAPAGIEASPEDSGQRADTTEQETESESVPVEKTGTETTTDEGAVGERRDVTSLTVEQLEAEYDALETDLRNEDSRVRFNEVERELEQREWDSVHGVDLDTALENLDKLQSKEGSFIEKSDIRASKAVINKYKNPSEISDSELRRDFRDAMLGNPESWYADGLKLKLSVQEAVNRGMTQEALFNTVRQEFVADGYSIEDADSTIARRIEAVSGRQRAVTSTQIQEGVTEAAPVVSTESEAQTGQYFTRDIGGDQTVYRRNEDGTASIVPDSEAQNILSQQTEAGGTSLQGSQQGGLSQNNAPATQDFFTAVVEGTDPRFIPIKPYETEGAYSPEQTKVAEAMEPKFGNFDTHIATSIPQYRETQVKKTAGIIAVLEGREDARVFDIGGSEGNTVKTITELTGVETYNLEPNEAMASSHEATPVEGSTVIREAFYEGFDGHEAHVPTEKYDVVNESMVFQFITPERKQFIDHVADNYLKEDGLFISEEKLKTNRDLYIENEAQKDSEHKSKYYTPEQLKLKSDQVLMGMDENQADVRDYIESLKDRFDHVGIYWNSGNFYGVAASNSKQTFDKFMQSVGDTTTPYTKVGLGEVTDVSTIPSSQDTQQTESTTQEAQSSEQITQELTTPTFFDTLTNSEQRSSRIEQLKQNLRDNIAQDSNLGISQDNRGRARREIQFARDLTELAILSIADGTIQTADAFRRLVGGLGDFSDTFLNSVYHNATEIAQSYVETNPSREGMDVATGQVLTRMQDATSDRTPAQTRIRPTRVRELTEGGITGRVNLTERQALQTQIRTLNRGIREGKRQITESRKEVSDFVKEMRNQGLFRGKVRGSTVAALINRVNRANTPRQLENALDYAEKASRILDYDQKVSQAGKLRDRAKTLSKRRGMPANLSASLKDIGRVDLRHVDNIEHFIDITDRFMATVEGQTTSTSDQEIQSLTDSISRLAEKAKVQRLQEMLIDAGMDADVVSELDTLPKLNEFIDSLPVEAKDNQGESRDDIRKRLYDEQREQLNEIDESTLTPLQKQALDALKELDVSGLEGEVLALAARGLTNAIVNGRFDGMRDIISEHAKQKMLSDRPFIQKVREAVRTPGKWGDSIRKTAGTVTARMVSVLHNPQNIGLVNRLVNYTGIKNSTVQAARRYEREVIRPLQDIFKKHRKDLSNPQEQVKLAMYQDLAQYRESWSQEERQKQFQDRKQAIEESIDRLETELENNEWATESQRNYLENLKAVYDSTIKNAQRPEDIEATLSAGARALNEFQQNFWANLFPEFVDNARITNNVDIDTDWVNYNPRSYQTVDARGERLKEEWESILNENGSAFFGNFNLSAETSGAQRNRTVTGAQLPSNKVIDLRAIDSFYEMSKKALYDIETQQERATASAMMRSGQIEAVVGSNVTMNVIRDAVMQKVRADAFQLLPPRERTTITRIWDGVQTWSARQALGGFLQIAKQSVPVVMDATIRLGSRAWMMPAAMQTYWRNTDAVNSMVNSRAVGSRAVQSIIQSEGRVRDKQRSQANRELRDRLGRITDLADRGIDLMTMEMLKIGDAASARSVWLAFYMEHRNRHGVKNIDIVQESENINQEAAEYADTMTDTVANISDPSLRPKMLSGGWGRAFSIISPFASFSINNKIDFVSNMARLREARDAGDVARIARNAAGNLTALVTYQAVGWGIRYMAIKSAAQLVTHLVNKAGDWDDEEEELAKEFIREWQEEKLEGNKWNSLFYLANDIAYGGIAQELVEPLAGQPIADLLNYVIGDEKIKAQQFQGGQWEGFGRYGIPATRVFDFYKNFSNWTETNEEYQMRKFSEEDAWGEQRYVPLEYTDIKRPEISRDAMGLVTVANSAAMFSLYNQEVASIVRRLPGLVREIENITDGLDKPDSLKELERLKSFTFKDKKIDLTDEQYEWAVKKRSELLDNIYEGTKYSWEAAVGDAESERELRKLATDYAKTLTVSQFRLFEGVGDRTVRQARQRFERGRKAAQKRLEQRAKRQGAINWDE